MSRNINQITFFRVEEKSGPMFERMNQLYCEAFDAKERRQSLVSAPVHPAFQMQALLRNGQFVGFLNQWNFDTFVFVEHVAILSEFRGEGLGVSVFKSLIASYPRIFAECEPANVGEEARRRIAFYERLGFVLNPYPYQQPSYAAHKKGVEMHFISYPQRLDPKEFEYITKHIHATVYDKGG